MFYPPDGIVCECDAKGRNHLVPLLSLQVMVTEEVDEALWAVNLSLHLCQYSIAMVDISSDTVMTSGTNSAHYVSSNRVIDASNYKIVMQWHSGAVAQ